MELSFLIYSLARRGEGIGIFWPFLEQLQWPSAIIGLLAYAKPYNFAILSFMCIIVHSSSLILTKLLQIPKIEKPTTII